MLVKHKVLVVGCGNMGAALAAGYAASHPSAQVVAIDRDSERAASLLPLDSPVEIFASPEALPDFCPELVILALKPQVLGESLADFVGLCSEALIVSIAAGVSVERLRDLFGGHRRIARAMPNLPVIVGKGMSVIYSGELSPADVTACHEVFEAVGDVAWVDDEALIDAATAVAGSGPAYFFAMVEHLAAAGVAEGLSIELAERLARQTCVGAAALLAADSRSAVTLKAAVCSPRGTTEAALAVMEGVTGLPTVVAAGVAAAHARARELAAC